MAARWLAFVVWALAAASAAFWGLRLIVKPPAAPEASQRVDGSGAPRADLARMLGAEPLQPVESAPVVAASSRFRLLGVAAPKNGNTTYGVALIAVDGKPARAYRVGASVDSDVVLQSVRTRGASLGARGGPTQVELELPPLPAPATGTLQARPPGPALLPPPVPQPPAGATPGFPAPAAAPVVPPGGFPPAFPRPSGPAAPVNPPSNPDEPVSGSAPAGGPPRDRAESAR